MKPWHILFSGQETGRVLPLLFPHTAGITYNCQVLPEACKDRIHSICYLISFAVILDVTACRHAPNMRPCCSRTTFVRMHLSHLAPGAVNKAHFSLNNTKTDSSLKNLYNICSHHMIIGDAQCRGFSASSWRNARVRWERSDNEGKDSSIVRWTMRCW